MLSSSRLLTGAIQCLVITALVWIAWPIAVIATLAMLAQVLWTTRRR